MAKHSVSAVRDNAGYGEETSRQNHLDILNNAWNIL